MSHRMDEFLAVGMKRYKQASSTMVSFGKEIEARLQKILASRTPEAWGRFVPTAGRKARSTKFWSEYPLFNAKIDGTIGSESFRLYISINWFDSETEYPLYVAGLEPHQLYQRYEAPMEEFEWRHGVLSFKTSKGVRLDPSEDDFDLERDFGILLDEFVRFLDEQPE